MQFIALFLILFIMGLIMGLIMAFPVMWSWNFLMPNLLHLPPIDYWQALVMYVLCMILFKSNNTTVKN